MKLLTALFLTFLALSPFARADDNVTFNKTKFVVANALADSMADIKEYVPEGAGPQFAEWNLMRVDKAIGDVQVVQYARRFYIVDEKVPKTINAGRTKILPQLSKLSLPE